MTKRAGLIAGLELGFLFLLLASALILSFYRGNIIGIMLSLGVLVFFVRDNQRGNFAFGYRVKAREILESEHPDLFQKMEQISTCRDTPQPGTLNMFLATLTSVTNEFKRTMIPYQRTFTFYKWLGVSTVMLLGCSLGSIFWGRITSILNL